VGRVDKAQVPPDQSLASRSVANPRATPVMGCTKPEVARRQAVLLVLMLAVSTLTFASARTNVLLGVVYLLLFLAYLMLIFEK
jgi:Ca2+/Na+ antiporter